MSIFFLFWWRSSLVLLYKKQISKSGFPIPVELCVSASRTKRSFFGCSWVALIIQDCWGIVAGWHHRDDLSAIFALVPALLVCKSRKSDTWTWTHLNSFCVAYVLFVCAFPVSRCLSNLSDVTLDFSRSTKVMEHDFGAQSGSCTTLPWQELSIVKQRTVKTGSCPLASKLILSTRTASKSWHVGNSEKTQHFKKNTKWKYKFHPKNDAFSSNWKITKFQL